MICFKEKLGIHWFELLALSLLGLPRIIFHDLSIIKEGTFINGLFVFIPAVIWILYLIMRGVSRPFTAMLLLCLVYGVVLAITHQLMWSGVFPNGIALGGNLSHLSGFSTIIPRTFAFFSSLATGAVLGVILGSVTWIISQTLNRIGGHHHED